MDGMQQTGTPAVAFEHVSKRFGDAVAVDDANLDIDEGAFVTIIGSSGCGKTTLLKMVNALAMPDDGRVLGHGKDTSGVNHRAAPKHRLRHPRQRAVSPPHRGAEHRVRALAAEQRRRGSHRGGRREMDGHHRAAARHHGSLSRRAVGRTGAARRHRPRVGGPDILLADEPFSAVDAITRGSLQDEIKRIHRQTGITVLFVTHDIDEALDLGDKVLVMEAGRAVQFAEPCDILRNPATEFVDRLVTRKRTVYAR